MSSDESILPFSRDQLGMTVNGNACWGDSSYPVFDPATEQLVSEAPDCDLTLLESAVASANEAFPSWAKSNERAEALSCCARLLKANALKFARLLTMEQGKPYKEALNEIMGASSALRFFAEFDRSDSAIRTGKEGNFDLMTRPLGVVAAITPWNYPIVLAVRKIAPALLAGNTVVLKPSPLTPLTTLALGRLFIEALPPGVLNIVSGGDSLGRALVAHPLVRMITLTGSTKTGREVARIAAENLKRVVLELGGNDAAIVLPDVNVAMSAPNLFWGAFRNCGQTCHAIKRLYVHETLADSLIAELSQIAENVTIGSGLARETELGPVNNLPQLQRVESLIADSKRNGAKLVTGGNRLSGPGYFFEPTLVDAIGDGVALVDEEQFGPVLPIIRYQNLDDAVRRANSSNYGLGGSVWSANVSLARETTKDLECGVTWMNQHGDTNPSAPIGGTKMSGWGYENGFEGLMEFARLQTNYQ